MPASAVTIGCGSAYANDRLEPAVALAKSGLVQYLAFDCLAERTLALAQLRRRLDDNAGQDERLPRIVSELAPFVASGLRVVGNFGAANPSAAMNDVLNGLRRAGVAGLRVGVIHGDEVAGLVRKLNSRLPELGCTVDDLGARFVSAHAYIGAGPIVALLDEGASFVLGGRIADPSLFVGPICHELGWDLADWDRVGTATVAGHLLECGTHGSGGNFADPPYRTVDGLDDVGLPFATISQDGAVEVTKLEGTGGRVDALTTKTQLAYEIHDPAAYLTPDVVADFSHVTVEEAGTNRVTVSGAAGRPRPDNLKVLVGIDLGWRAVGEISFGGPGCVSRARLGEELVRRRLGPLEGDIEDIRYDLVGMTSLFGDRLSSEHPAEVRLRVAARCSTKEAAAAVAYEVECLYFGPAGAGGATQSVVPAIGVTPAFVPADDVHLDWEIHRS
jgi:hypothetical protein